MFANLANLISARKRAANYDGDYNQFSDLSIAASFDPLHHIFASYKVDPLVALKFLVEQLQVNNIRLSIRWSQVYETGKLNLGFYKPFLDYCLANSVEVVLNVGPIKTMRWPEEHIPTKLHKLVAKRDTITLAHPLAQPALSYLGELLTALKTEYKPKQLQNIVAWQADNELFNRFGQFELLISEEFEAETLKIISSEFPDAAIFINSSSTNDFKSIFNLLAASTGNFILGVNYYYSVPPIHRIPILRQLDNLILRKPFSISPAALSERASSAGYAIEVSELQGEPWWPQILTPGNSFQEFIFTLLRTQYLRPAGQLKIKARHWGIEDLICKFLTGNTTAEHQQIRDLIQAINSL
jgi:hypothetical protein